MQVKQIYNQTLKQPIDRLNNIKDITTNKVGKRDQNFFDYLMKLMMFPILKVSEVIKAGTTSIDTIKSYGCDQLNKSAVLGVRVMDACLESSLAKMFTDPVLNFTENALDFLIPETTTTNGIALF